MKINSLLLFGIAVALIITSFHWTDEGVPKTWDLAAIKSFHLLPPDTSVKIVYASEEYYDKLPEHVITKTYPVYLREFEKPGYLDSLRHLKPEIIFEPSRLKTQQDWIDAGELVFNWPVAYSPMNENKSRNEVSQFKNSKSKASTEGVYLASRYVLGENGKLMVGSLSCASCHTQVLPSGKIVSGAPGNIFNNQAFAEAVRSGRMPVHALQDGIQRLNYAPWAPANFTVTANDFADYILSVPPGVVDRQGVAYLYPVTVPSLIGVKDIKYFDRTGLMRHEGPGDLMRYAAFNQGMDMLTSYNNFTPGGDHSYSTVANGKGWNHPFNYAPKKYSDEQLYALTQYIYSLRPPDNPNHFPEELIQLGKKVFNRSGCVTCHTPPLYTNNKLTPVNGFEPPPDHFAKYDIFNVSVETDSVTTLYSRRGTGYYKVPSLRGVWHQLAFFHNGNLGSLEEVFDSRRLSNDYVPGGYKPPHLKTMKVKGHPFGLDLTEKEKNALIAFLKTL